MTMNRLLLIERRPAAISTLYLGTIFILVTGWLPATLGAGIGTASFDALFLTGSLLMLWRYGAKRDSLLTQQIFWAGYLATGFLLAVWVRSVNLLDFAQAYKFVWYLALLAPFAWAEGAMKPIDFRRLLNISLVMFFLVYAIKRLLGFDRPTLIGENNFELVFLALVYYSAFVAGTRISIAQTLTLLVIVVLSGSRSAAIAVALAVALTYDFRTRSATKLIGGLIAGAVGIVLALIVFESRSHGGIESIDRFRFFLMFSESVADWGLFDYLLGADRLTPLPSHVCSSLSYYASLFSYDKNGTCYSVILHSFNLRIIYDHGIIIALLAGLYLLRLTRSATLIQRGCLIGIIFVNGLSVSALNSVYTALGIAFFCLAASANKAEHTHSLE